MKRYREAPKATKYEHLLPKLAEIENDTRIDGVLILLNTMGGDVEAGLAIAEMIASLSKPTVSLVLGGCHSIGGLAGSGGKLLFYCTKRHNDHPSGAFQWNDDWCDPELPEYGKLRTGSRVLFRNILVFQ